MSGKMSYIISYCKLRKDYWEILRCQLIPLSDPFKETRSFTSCGRQPLVIWLYGNVILHIHSSVKDTLLQLGWEVLKYPAYISSQILLQLIRPFIQIVAKHLGKYKVLNCWKYAKMGLWLRSNPFLFVRKLYVSRYMVQSCA